MEEVRCFEEEIRVYVEEVTKKVTPQASSLKPQDDRPMLGAKPGNLGETRQTVGTEASPQSEVRLAAPFAARPPSPASPSPDTSEPSLVKPLSKVVRQPRARSSLLGAFGVGAGARVHSSTRHGVRILTFVCLCLLLSHYSRRTPASKLSPW